MDNEGSMNFFKYLAIIFRYKWLVLVLFLLLMLSGIWVVSKKQELYSAHAKILVNYQMEGVSDISRYFMRGTIAYLVKTYSMTIVSNSVIAATKKRLSLPYGVSYLRSRVYVQTEENTNLLDITATLPDKELVADFVNVLIEEYIKQHQAFMNEDATRARDYISEQLKTIQDDLSEAQRKIKVFKEKNNVVDVNIEMENLVSTYSDLGLKKTAAEMEYKSVRESLDKVKGQIASLNTAGGQRLITDIEKSPEYISYQRLQEEYEKARVYYSEDSDYFKNLEKKLEELKIQLLSRLSNENSSENSILALYAQKGELEKRLIQLELEIQKTDYILRDLDKKFKMVPEREMEYLNLQRQLSVSEKLYTLLLEQDKELELQKISQGSTIRVVDNAVKPSRPVTTSKVQYLIFMLFLSLIVSVGFAFLIEYLDNTVKPSDDIERIFETDLIGKIPEIYKSEEKLSKWAIITGQRAKYITRTFKENLITNISPKSTINESYKELRTLLTYSKWAKDKKGLKSFLITSSETKEGKSITAANLSIMLSKNNKKTILIDTDMRKPSLHRIFEIDNSKGISSYFEDDYKDMSELVKMGVNPFHYLITCGPHTHASTEYLDSPKLQTLIGKLGEMGFEYVLFDTPPVNALTDAVVLSNKVDGVLFVIRANQIAKHRAKIALESIKKSGGRLIGIILNGIPIRGGYGYYYYYYGQQYYYSYDDVDKK